MKVLCLVDGKVVPPDRWIWNYLPEDAQRDSVEFMNVGSVQDKFPKWGKLLTYYPGYFALAWQALQRARSENYDVIVGWESKHGFPVAVLRTLLRIKSPPLVILAFAYKGIGMNFAGLGRLAMKAVDYINVPTRAEAKFYHEMLAYPMDRIEVAELGWYRAEDVLGEALPTDEADYAFAGGRTSRDYKTLLEAVAGLDVPIVVNARKFNVEGLVCPPNVTLNEFMPPKEYYRCMARSRFIIVPLVDTPHAAGLSHILHAMSVGKAMVATRTVSTVDYIEDGITGLLVEPNNPQAMRKAVQHLAEHPEEARAMGQRARQRFDEHFTFKAFAERTYRTLQNAITRSKG